MTFIKKKVKKANLGFKVDPAIVAYINQKRVVEQPPKPVVLDELSFGQQFAYARKEMLNGGPSTFLWRGKLYGTQLAGEKSVQSRPQKDDIDIKRSPSQQLPQQRTTVPVPGKTNVWPIPQNPPTNVWGQPVQVIPVKQGWTPEPINPWKQTIPVLPKSDGSVEKSRRSVNPYYADDAPMPKYTSFYPLPIWFTQEMVNPWIQTQPKPKQQPKQQSASEKIANRQDFKHQKNKQ